MIIYLQMIEDPKDGEKFELIFNYYKAYVFKIINNILHNHADAEDALQETFAKIAKNIKKIGDAYSQKTKGYIYIIAENSAIDKLREINRTTCEEFKEDEIESSAPLPDVDDDLSQCILQLPLRYRQFILLKYYHGYTTKEIAQIFDIKPVAASKLGQRAKNKLEEICRREGIL